MADSYRRQTRICALLIDVQNLKQLHETQYYPSMIILQHSNAKADVL